MSPLLESCRICHSSVEPYDQFCRNCGQRLTPTGKPDAPHDPSSDLPLNTQGDLTSEQLRVVQHPRGRHARVMAVAGSGKTTTMVRRIEHLIRNESVNPRSITVLVYNALARQDFKRKLRESGIPEGLQPSRVHTFHSFAYSVLLELIDEGIIPKWEFLTDDGGEERARYLLHKAIRELGMTEKVDPSEASDAISLWKGSLIPPDRAGYHGSPIIPKVYAEYERQRVASNFLTFDDMVPSVVTFLESTSGLSSRWCNQAEFVIADEYQDVNFGQQRLLELVAGSKADVMVVGDDDQTIYEWRGARPNYIIREFQQRFGNKPHSDYRLSRSFRFGPIVAQSAQNVISFNNNRVDKFIASHNPQQVSDVVVVTDRSNQSSDVNVDLADRVLDLVNNEDVPPSEIAVLVRMYSQLGGLETAFMSRKIPYHVLGAKPFFERREIRTLLDYVKVCLDLTSPLTQTGVQQLLSVANTPSRMISRAKLEQLLQSRLGQLSALDALTIAIASNESTFSRAQQEQLSDLTGTLQRGLERLGTEEDLQAGPFIEWLATAVNYDNHFDNYYGKGEHSADRKLAIRNLIDYANFTKMRPVDFLAHVKNQDPTWGAPKEKQVLMTTIFKTKGLEYDYVLLPHCEEGYMPCLYSSETQVFDLAGRISEPEPSQAIENERRLFYVGLTRAKKQVLIGTSQRPEMGLLRRDSIPSRFLEEIDLESVSAVMKALGKSTIDETSQSRVLLSELHKWGSRPWVKRSILDNYLSLLQESGLTGPVAELLASVNTEPFAYKHAYPSSSRVGTDNPDAP